MSVERRLYYSYSQTVRVFTRVIFPIDGHAEYFNAAGQQD
jgi:hypothetical protein